MTIESWDDEGYVRNALADALNRIEAMKVALTEDGLDRISLRVALAVEDQFAQHHPGGRTQRLAKIQVLIRSAVQGATQGQVAWDAWHPGSCGPVPREPTGAP